MASWHNRKFGYLKPLMLAMAHPEPYRRTFQPGEWRGSERFYKVRDFRQRRDFIAGQWRKPYMPLSRIVAWIA